MNQFLNSVYDCILEIRCLDPPSVHQGIYQCSSTAHRMNDTCVLQCSTGFKPQLMSSDIRCMSNEKWSSPSACIGMCSANSLIFSSVFLY